MQIETIYEILSVPIDQIVPNPMNPRLISEEKLERLVNSVREAPWMLKLRPIVVNKDGVVLGGNQRFKAAVKAGLTHVWVMKADQITDKQQRTFILRDNIDFGRWDQQILRKQYSNDELLKYGVEIELLASHDLKMEDFVGAPAIGGDEEFEPELSDDEVERSRQGFNDSSIKQIVFFFDDSLYEEVLKDLDKVSRELDCDDNSDVLLRLINFYEVCNGLSQE